MKTDAFYRGQVQSAGMEVGSQLENAAAYTLLRAGLAGSFGLVQQHRVEGYRLDFAWPDIQVAVEVDGPIHFAPSKAALDAVRDSHLRDLGWLIFRVDGEYGIDGLRRQLVGVCRVIHLIDGCGR